LAVRHSLQQARHGTLLRVLRQPDARRQPRAVAERDPGVIDPPHPIRHHRLRARAGGVSTLLSRHPNDVSVRRRVPVGSHADGDFASKYPGANSKQVSESSISSGAVVPAIKANLSTYDAALGDQAVAGQAIAADVLQPLDWSKIPNIKNVDEKFRQAYSHGIQSEYGKTGIGYRTDLVSEDITSWADVWNLAEKYSGKIVFTDLDRDCIGSALKYR